MSLLRKLFLKERRKNKRLREIIERHDIEGEKFRDAADRLIATINGDPNWFDMHCVSEEEEKENGHGVDPVCGDPNLCGN